MGYKSYRLGVFFRVILLTASILLAVLLSHEPSYRFSMFLLILLSVVQVILLIRYTERVNRKLGKFLNSIRYSDFATSFKDDHLGPSFRELNTAFNEVIRQFHLARAEKEEHYNYLRTVVQHVSIGIITYRRDGKVDLYNNAIKRLLRLNSLNSVQELSSVRPELPELLLRLKAGDRELIKLFIGNEFLQVLVYATEFRLRDEDYILVGMQDIHGELEAKEIESWQNLIRVLTHEIMNSMTPISSLATTVRALLVDEENGELLEVEEEDAESIVQALDTITSRSQALLHFVETYRNLTRIPKPSFRHFPVKQMLERAQLLLGPKYEELGIATDCQVIPSDLHLTADPDLLDQVIINLLVNAIDAVRGRTGARVGIRAYANDSGRVIIEVSDNGHGIKPDILDKIFMPFFTSKKEGSGIGLSLSRQIMHLHKGSISVRSVPEEGSVFSLAF